MMKGMRIRRDSHTLKLGELGGFGAIGGPDNTCSNTSLCLHPAALPLIH